MAKRIGCGSTVKVSVFAMSPGRRVSGENEGPKLEVRKEMATGAAASVARGSARSYRFESEDRPRRYDRDLPQMDPFVPGHRTLVG